MIQGASQDQLSQLDSICEEYLERIRVAKGKSPKKAIQKFSELELEMQEEKAKDDKSKELTEGINKELSENNKEGKTIVGIMTRKAQMAGEKPLFFPH